MEDKSIYIYKDLKYFIYVYQSAFEMASSLNATETGSEV